MPQNYRDTHRRIIVRAVNAMSDRTSVAADACVPAKIATGTQAATSVAIAPSGTRVHMRTPSRATVLTRGAAIRRSSAIDATIGRTVSLRNDAI
jgi:hypothetical protein